MFKEEITSYCKNCFELEQQLDQNKDRLKRKEQECSEYSKELARFQQEVVPKLRKQLRNKEQECEELKKIINEAKNSKLDLNSFFAIEAIVGEYQLELDQLKEQLEAYKMEADEGKEINAELKAENEELTTINARLLGRLEVDETDTSLVFNLDKELRQKEKEFYTAIQKVVKLKQTLTEIKEIAKKIANYYDGDEYELMRKDAEQILQKISEVE